MLSFFLFICDKNFQLKFLFKNFSTVDKATALKASVLFALIEFFPNQFNEFCEAL